jgi:hypothetical protein
VSNDSLLTGALRDLAQEEAHLGPSSAVRGRLMAEMRAVAGRDRRAAARHNVLAFAAAAALVVAAGTSAWQSFARRAAAASTRTASAPASREVATEFLPLTYSGVPLSGGQMIRLEVPRAALASFGLTPPEAAEPGQSAGTVIADVVVGDDGLARAVRFVRSSN